MAHQPAAARTSPCNCDRPGDWWPPTHPAHTHTTRALTMSEQVMGRSRGEGVEGGADIHVVGGVVTAYNDFSQDGHAAERCLREVRVTSPRGEGGLALLHEAQTRTTRHSEGELIGISRSVIPVGWHCEALHAIAE